MAESNDQLKSTQIVQKPDMVITPDTAIPLGLLNASPQEILDAEIDVATSSPDDDTSIDSVISVQKTDINFTPNVVVVEQKIRYTADGKLVVDVVLDVFGGDENSQYEVRVTRP